MAKLKLWVKNLIVILVLAISIAGVGVGLYFLLRPTDSGGPSDRELSQAQKDYISAIVATPQPDIDISTYDGLVLEDGTAVDVGDIVYACGNYVVIENASKPEFYALVAEDSSASQGSGAANLVNTQANNVLLTKVDILDDYNYIVTDYNQEYQIFGDYAILATSKSNGEYQGQFIVSLKTGETVLTNSGDTMFDGQYINETEGENYAGSYWVEIAEIANNFIMTSKTIINSVNLETEEADYTTVLTFCPLDNPAQKITFGQDVGELVDYSITSNYVTLVTTKYTYVYNVQLSSTGEWQEVLILNNTFTAATSADDARVESLTYGTFSEAVYHNIQVMDNGLILVEKCEVLGDSFNEEDYDVTFVVDLFDLDGLVAGIDYSIYNTNSKQYQETIPDFFGKVTVKDSFASGYYIFKQTYGGWRNHYEYGPETTTIYNSDFTYVTEYESSKMGDIIGYNGEAFITSGTNISTIINPWGEDASHHSGFSIVSDSVYDGIVVAKNDIYYYLYNTITGAVYCKQYLFISEIMNGKVIGYKEDTGYFEINLKDSSLPETSIYNFDTQSLNLAMASVGFYFTCTNNIYTYVGLNGTTYTNISSYNYKIINGNVYLSLNFSGGETKLIVATMLSTLGTLSDQDIAEDYSANQTPSVIEPSATSLVAASDITETLAPDASGSSSISQTFVYGRATVTLTSENGIPSYTIDLGTSTLSSISENSKKDFDEAGISIGYFVDNEANDAYGNLRTWWDNNYSSINTDAQFLLPEAVTQTDVLARYIWWGRDNYDETTMTFTNLYMSEVYAIKTPYSFVIAATYKGDRNGTTVYTNRVVVGLDRTLYVSSNVGNIKSGDSLMSTCCGGKGAILQDRYREYYDFPALSWSEEASKGESNIPVFDFGSSVVSDADLVAQGIGTENNFSGLTAAAFQEAGRAVSGFNEQVLGGNNTTSYAMQIYAEDGCTTDAQTATVDLIISPWATEFTRYYGLVGSDKEVGYYKDKDANSSSGLVNVTFSNGDSDDKHDPDYRNSVTIAKNLDLAQVKVSNMSIDITHYEGPGWSTSTTSNSITCYGGSSSHGLLECWSKLGKHTYYQRICYIELTISFEQTSHKTVGTIYTANPTNPYTPNSTNEELFIANGVHSKIEYGFYSKAYTSSYTSTDDSGKQTTETSIEAVAGTKRENLAIYTQNCTFGYQLVGMLQDCLSTTDWDYEHDNNCAINSEGVWTQISYKNSDYDVTIFPMMLSLTGTKNITPCQVALEFTIQRYWLPQNYQGDPSVATTEQYTENDGSATTYKYNQTLEQIDTGVNSVYGYTITAWKLLANSENDGTKTYIKYDSSATNHSTTPTEHVNLTKDMKLSDYLYFAYVGELDLTVNEDVQRMLKQGTPTLMVYAVYEAKDVTFTINLENVYKDNTQVQFYYLDSGSFKDECSLEWQTTVKYNTNLNIPIMYVYLKDKNAYYKVAFYHDNHDNQGDNGYAFSDDDSTLTIATCRFFDSDKGKTITANYYADSELQYVLADKCWYDSTEDTLEASFNVTITPMKYVTTYKGSQDSHLYSNASDDLVYENRQEVANASISGNSGLTFTDDYGINVKVDVNELTSEMMYGEKTAFDSFYSGNSYTLSFENFNYQNHTMVLAYTLNEEVYTLYVNNKENVCGTNIESYYYSSENVWCCNGTEPSQPFWAVENNDDTLKITINNVGGGAYDITKEDDTTKGCFNGNISIKAEIKTLLFDVSVKSQEDNGSSTQYVDVGNLTLSDTINDYVHANQFITNTDDSADIDSYLFGSGTTILINAGDSAYRKVNNLNMSVINSYINSVQIDKDGSSIFSWTASAEQLKLLSDVSIDIIMNPDAKDDNNNLIYRTLLKGDDYADIWYSSDNTTTGLKTIMFGSTDVTNMGENEIQARKNAIIGLLCLLYDKDSGYFSSGATVTYYIMPITSETQSETQTLYMMLTYHTHTDEGKSLGLRTGIFYTLADDYNFANEIDAADKNNKYEIVLKQTNYSNVLTWTAENINNQQDTDLGLVDDNRYYFKATTTFNDVVYQTDEKGYYLTILDRKVYVKIATNNAEEANSKPEYYVYKADEQAKGMLIVDTTKTAAADFDSLFGTGKVLEHNYEAGTGYLFNQQGANGNVWVEWVEGYTYTETKEDETEVSKKGGSWYYDDSGEVAAKSITGGDVNFAGVQPSNTFTYNINVKAGYYIKEVTITYNGVTYTITLTSFKIDSDEQTISPIYTITGPDGHNTEFNFSNGNSAEIKKLLLNVTFATLPITDSKTVISLTMGIIGAGAHINVQYGAYALLAVDAPEGISWNSNNDNKNPTELSVYQNEKSDNKLATILFVGSNPSSILAASRIGTGVSFKGLTAGADNSGTKIYFMLLDYKLDDGTDSTKYMNIESSFTENTLYRLQIVTEDGKIYKNTAKWQDVNTNTKTTQQNVVNTAGSNFIASLKIETKAINTNITSDIDFGTTDNQNVVEETLFIKDDKGSYVLYDNGYEKYDSGNSNHEELQRYTPSLTTDLFYEVGNGQIASTGTNVDYNKDDNFGSIAQEQNYNAYGDSYALIGNKLVYTIKTVYGYTLDKITLNIKVTPNSDTLAVTAGESIDPIDIVRNGENWTVPTSDYITSLTLVGSGNTYTLTIVLKDAAITDINVDLHYNAKEFEVTYNTSADFGTSYVGQYGTEETSKNADNLTRTFTYNVKADVDGGVIWNGTKFADNTSNVVYNRIGYDLVGWAFGEFYKDSNGKTIDTTKIDLTKLNKTDISNFVTNEEVADEYDYILQKYSLATDAGYNWYASLGATYGDVFGEGNGEIVMYAIWQAKDYILNFDYNDLAEGHGSTNSTKIYEIWTFDMPLTASDYASDKLTLSIDASWFKSADKTQLSRVYRLGYTFDGWYYSEVDSDMTRDSANSTSDWTGAVLTDGGVNNSSIESEIWTTFTGRLGYSDRNVDTQNTNLFGYNLYKLIREYYSAIDGENLANCWNEVAGETTSTIKLFAKWTANTYTFVYDLNGEGDLDGASDANGYEYLTLNDGNVGINEKDGLGSSQSYLGSTEAYTTVNVVFDSEFGENIKGYAYRNGYKFMGWTDSRNTAEETLLSDDELLEAYPLLEGTTLNRTTLNLDALLKMMGYSSATEEIDAIKAKAAKNFGGNSMSVVETLMSDGLRVGDYNDVTPTYTGNIMLLHAVWQALPYTINIDLNNWNHADYSWTDGDYFAGDNEYLAKNNVATTDIKLEIYFDQAFSTIKLYVDDSLVTPQTGTKTEDGETIEYIYYTTTIIRNNVTYAITGDTAYDVLIQILTAYGYELGLGDNDFVLSADGTGTGTYGAEYLIKADTAFDNNHFNLAIYSNPENEPLEAGNSIETEKLENLDKSYNQDPVTVDLHDTDIDDEKFGARTFTLFALWTIKNVNISSSGAKEQYSNALDVPTTYPILFHDDQEDTVKFVAYNGNQANLFATQEKSGIYNSNNTYYLSPSTGQYIEQLTIWFADNYYINGATTNQIHGYIHLTFAWNSVTHEVTITSAKYGYGEDITKDYVELTIKDNKTLEINDTYNADCKDLQYLFKNGFKIEVSKYQQLTTQNGKNINTYYQDNVSTYGEDAPAWLTDANLKDVNYLTITVNGVKSNMCFETTTKGQTYQVDYYRFIRPTDGIQTYIDEDSQSETFGQEIWDSEFLNSWSQYEVYKTETFKYGQYANTGYSYATNFAFSGWYYYQGHIIPGDDDEGYSNYDSADHIYQTHKDGDNRYCTLCGDYCVLESNYLIYDFLGKWGTFKTQEGSDEEKFEKDAVKTYVWDTTDLKYYLKTGENSDGSSIVDKEDYLDGIPVAGTDTFTRYQKYDEDGNLIDVEILTVRNYQYNSDYKDYKFDGKPVSANISLVGIYVPAGERKVHYYTWKDSESTAAGYEERQQQEDQKYVLGVKRIAEVTDDGNGLDRTYLHVRYWELGTNEEYYNVGFAGFSRFDGDHATELAALEFLMQFVNQGNYERYNLDGGKIEITYTEVLEVIANLCTSRLGIEESTIIPDDRDVKTVALNLQKALLKQEVYTAYIYLGISETLAQLGIEGLSINADVSKFDETDENWQNNIKALYTTLIGSAPSAGLSYAEIGNAIIDLLTAKQLDVVLNAVANDYFGFVLINPSANIGYWPQGTYLTGWYMVPETMLELLMDAEKGGYGYVFTFNSETWPKQIDENGNVVYDSNYPLPITIKETRPENVNGVDLIIYTVSLGGQTFDVTRFSTYDNVYNLHMLSRVETSVHIFAAYNVHKFEMTTSGVGDTDIQWGTDVQQSNGEYYQYSASDVHYIALTEEQMTSLAVELSKNNNLPTSLQTVITFYSLVPKTTMPTTENTFVIAFVYNKQLNGGTVEDISDSINTVALQCYDVNGGVVSDLLEILYN